MKTMINVKTDAKVKKEAQKVAKEMGVPLSTIINTQLRQFISEKRVVFEMPYVLKPHIARELERESAYMESRPDAFDQVSSIEDLIEDFKRLRSRNRKKR